MLPDRTGSKGTSPANSEHSATAESQTTEHGKSLKGVCTAKAELQKEPVQIQTQWERGNISFGLLGKSSLCALVRATHVPTEQLPKRISTGACRLEAQKGDFPCEWSQPNNPSLGHSASPFFISPGSLNANLLKCLFIAGSWRLVELKNLYSRCLQGCFKTQAYIMYEAL